MGRISHLSSELSSKFNQNRNEANKLNESNKIIKSLQFIVSLPQKLRVSQLERGKETIAFINHAVSSV